MRSTKDRVLDRIASTVFCEIIILLLHIAIHRIPFEGSFQQLSFILSFSAVIVVTAAADILAELPPYYWLLGFGVNILLFSLVGSEGVYVLRRLSGEARFGEIVKAAAAILLVQVVFTAAVRLIIYIVKHCAKTDKGEQT